MTESLMGWLSPAVALVFLGIAVLLVIVIWSIKRHRSPKLKIESGASIEDLMPSLAGLALGTAVAGNSIEVLENGAFFDVLLERIRAAEKSVHFETFLWKEGVLGQRMADALSGRARAGCGSSRPANSRLPVCRYSATTAAVWARPATPPRIFRACTRASRKRMCCRRWRPPAFRRTD